jgi:O-antigen/teichoic acid export membrane protein
MILRLLAPTVLVFGIINPLRWLLMSIGLVGRSVKIVFVLACLVTVAYFIGLPYGPRGLAIAYSIAMMIWIIPHMYWSIRNTRVSLADLFYVASKPAFSSLAAGMFSFVLVHLLNQSISSLGRLLIGCGSLLSVYLGMLLFVMNQKELYFDLIRGMIRHLPVSGNRMV